LGALGRRGVFLDVWLVSMTPVSFFLPLGAYPNGSEFFGGLWNAR